MPMPWTYRHATKEFRAFLDDAKERMSLVSDNSTYTAVDGVFRVFRRRLTAQQGLDFANVIPSVPRAIFVQQWILDIPPLPFAPRDVLSKEVKQLRVNHNLTPDNAIEATAFALRRSLHQRDLDRVLAQIGSEAVAFWHVEVANPRELDQRIV